MIKKDISLQSRYFRLFIFTVLFFTGFRSIAKQTGSIILKDKQVPVKPKEFYIANLIDERDDRSAVAWLLPAAGKENQVKTYPVDLQGGGFVAIKQFISRNLPCN